MPRPPPAPDYSSMSDDDFRQSVQREYGYDPLGGEANNQPIEKYDIDQAVQQLLEILDAGSKGKKKKILEILTPIYNHHKDFRNPDDPVEIPLDLFLAIGWYISGSRWGNSQTQKNKKRGRDNRRDWEVLYEQLAPEAKTNQTEAARKIAEAWNRTARKPVKEGTIRHHLTQKYGPSSTVRISKILKSKPNQR